MRRGKKSVDYLSRGGRCVERMVRGGSTLHRCRGFVGVWAEDATDPEREWAPGADSAGSARVPLGKGRGFSADLPVEDATGWAYLFAGSGVERVDHLPHDGVVTNIQRLFSGCERLKYVGRMYPLGQITSNGTATASVFSGCTALERIEMMDATLTTSRLGIGLSDAGESLRYMLLKGFGARSTATSSKQWQLERLRVWGEGSEENRRSLVDSLLTYSHDRAKVGWASFTVTLHSETFARLSLDEIAAIAAKGYTITV